jgi:hypothetical protein
MTIIPAYGRDYSSKAAVLADLNADKAFTIADISSRWDGRSVVGNQIPEETLYVRYAKLRKVLVAVHRNGTWGERT